MKTTESTQDGGLVVHGVGVISMLALSHVDHEEAAIVYAVDPEYVSVDASEQSDGSVANPLPFTAESLGGLVSRGFRRYLSGVGATHCMTMRQRGFSAARSHGLQVVSSIHPNVPIGRRTTLAAGALIMEGAVVQDDVSVGEGAIIWPGAVLCHDSRLGAHVYLSPNVTLCGGVTLGDRVIVGAGAVLKQGISVCSDVVIGMGSVVLNDLASPGVYVGNPARFLRSDTAGNLLG